MDHVFIGEAALIRCAAMKLLAHRDHATFELQQKLAQKGYDLVEINEVLADLSEKKYLCDERYAESIVRWQKARGVGPVKIGAYLKARKVSPALIAEALKINDNTWFEIARQVLAKRSRGKPPENAKENLKYQRFLQQRGFTSEQMKAAIK